jgi:DNA mismatch endonuclease (patch repair protein)
MDTVSHAKRSWIMGRVKSKGGKSTELKIIQILREKGLKGWRRNFKLPGKPDFVYPKLKIAIFVDGCFWHGCKKHCRLPSSNQKYWIEKIKRNKIRDKNISKNLKLLGWQAIRIWEHEIGTSQMTRKLKIVVKLILRPHNKSLKRMRIKPRAV